MADEGHVVVVLAEGRLGGGVHLALRSAQPVAAGAVHLRCDVV